MNKEDYLRKKGRLPKEDFGSVFVFKSTPGGVGEIQEHLIWEKESRHYNVIASGGRREVPYTKFKLKDSPFECQIDDDKTLGVESQYGSGVGDLWAYSFFCSLDKQVLENAREEEAKRIEEKYEQAR
jgi:hypothetical protein